MTDFYAELGLEREKKLDEINADLIRLESTWKRREITNPEKATTMLALIIQAKKAFASETSRRTYDSELDGSRRQPEKVDQDKERNGALNRWKEQAQTFYSNGEYDLAKVAVENALSLSSTNDDNDLFSLAAGIYQENDDLKMALTYINRAIVAAPEMSRYYLSKGLIYEQRAIDAMERRGEYAHSDNSFSEAEKNCFESRKMFQLADTKSVLHPRRSV